MQVCRSDFREHWCIWFWPIMSWSAASCHPVYHTLYSCPHVEGASQLLLTGICILDARTPVKLTLHHACALALHSIRIRYNLHPGELGGCTHGPLGANMSLLGSPARCGLCSIGLPVQRHTVCNIAHSSRCQLRYSNARRSLHQLRPLS